MGAPQPGLLEFRLGEPLVQRKTASPNARKAIYQRDGHECLLCGAISPLELDHMRALMNGGDNSLANLATLCANCNKSAMKRVDNKINKQRRKRLDQRRRNALSAPDEKPETQIIVEAITESVEQSIPN